MQTATHPDDLIVRRAVQFRRDPAGWARYAYDWGNGDLAKHAGPRDWQLRVMNDIRDHLANPATRHQPLRLARASGHGIGKSACIGMLINWAMSTAAGTRVVVTANTEKQLLTKTWPEVSKWARLSLTAHWWNTPAMSIYATEPGGEKFWRGDAIPWSENNTEAFAGLHNEGKRILLVFDEGSSISDKVWEVAEGALTDEGTEIIWIVFGNPTQNTGRFRECFGKYRHLWNTEKIDSRTVDGTNKVYLDEFVATHGEDSDIVRVRVRGEFPRQAATQFINSETVDEAMSREPPIVDRGAPLIMGVDIARFGDDSSVVRFRQGRDGRVVPPVRWAGMDTVFSAGKIATLIDKYRPEAVFIDGGGVGGGVIDLLKSQAYRVIEVNFGSAAGDATRYANKRAEMWGEMRDWLATGAIDRDSRLRDDLTGPEYTFDRNSRLLLERKEDMKQRGLASPDDGDALALCFAGPVARTDMKPSRGALRGVVSRTDYSVLD